MLLCLIAPVIAQIHEIVQDIDKRGGKGKREKGEHQGTPVPDIEKMAGRYDRDEDQQILDPLMNSCHLEDAFESVLLNNKCFGQICLFLQPGDAFSVPTATADSA